MKILICIVLSLCLLPLGGIAKATETPPTPSAKSAVVLDMASKTVLFQKNANTPLPMASTTKIMTTLLLIEQGSLQQPITVTEEMVQVEGTSMGLLPGDTVTREALCYGMMLASGNDAANTAAIIHSGSIEAFANQMNQKAKALGMKNTLFVTPSGLDQGNHHSTAYDMALLTAYALENPTFAKIVASCKATLSYGNPPYQRTLTNHNRLLSSYEGCIGVKTGFTKKAGRCLVSAAEKQGATLIAVTLNAPNDWQDHTSLLTYGFSQMKWITRSAQTFSLPVVGGTASQIAVTHSSFTFAVPAQKATALEYQKQLPAFVYAPVKANHSLGKLQVLCNGNPVASCPLVATKEIPQQQPSLSFWQKFWANFCSFFA